MSIRDLVCALVATFSFVSLGAIESAIQDKIDQIMHQEKYSHATWRYLFKDAETGRVLIQKDAEEMALPASTTKLFSVAALLHAYGDDYRFKTPVYAIGSLKEGSLNGSLVLVAQGDLTMGGRQDGTDKIAFTKLDHINANEVPGVALTPEDPLYGLNQLAKMIKEKGIREIQGDVLIDDRLFETEEKRGMILSPMILNENLIDLVFNPAEVGKPAEITWLPKVPGYTIATGVKTVAQGEPLDIQISSDPSGRKIILKGTIPVDQKDIVRTFSVKDPVHFGRAAFIQALRAQGIKLNNANLDKPHALPPQKLIQDIQPIAVWTSPPLYEYAKLILKVSHNLGANLVPLLLAVKKGKKTFAEGMLELGKFTREQAKVSPASFVFIDGAGGDENRLTPNAEVQILDYMRKQPAAQFNHFYDALPILGVDGSLEDFAKNTSAVGKVRAKPGTGVSFNLGMNQYFLTTQALAGYIEGKDGHLIEFMLSVNNGEMPEIKDIFPIFEDLSQITAIIYEGN